MNPGADQLVQDPAGSSAVVGVAAVAVAECACGGSGVEASVEVGPDVTGLAEPGIG